MAGILASSIHPDFSDSCYRVLGAKYFNRLGDFVSIAIRSSCEVWAESKSGLDSLKLKAAVSEANTLLSF